MSRIKTSVAVLTMILSTQCATLAAQSPAGDGQAPSGTLDSADPVPGLSGVLDMRWTAHAQAEGAKLQFVSIEWAKRNDGPWHSIGELDPNSDHYSWKVPAEVPEKVYLRLTIRDTAGREAIAQTHDPCLLQLDRKKPK